MEQNQVEQELPESQNQSNSNAPQGPSGFYQPTIMPSEKADLYAKIDPQSIVDYLRYKLMGFEFDAQKQEWYRPSWAKGLSEKGAAEITTLMLPVSSKNVLISKLTDDEIRERTKYISKTAVKMCIQNWKDYGISGSDQIYLVKEIVISNTFITLKQPENAGAREFLGKSSSENKSIVEDSTKQNGFIGLFRK